jgi:TRAP-type C4-dicarboxylate transport system permease small subunit
MRAVIEKVAAIGASIASVLFILAGAMLTYEVVARYFFTKPTRWAAELSQMCLIWGSLLAMAWLLKKRQHIQVDAVVRLLPGALARIIDRIVMLLVAIFSIVVCWYGFEIFYDSFSRGRTTGSLLNIPIWIVELAVPAGFALLALQALLETSRPSTEDSSAEHTP